MTNFLFENLQFLAVVPLGSTVWYTYKQTSDSFIKQRKYGNKRNAKIIAFLFTVLPGLLIFYFQIPNFEATLCRWFECAVDAARLKNAWDNMAEDPNNEEFRQELVGATQAIGGIHERFMSEDQTEILSQARVFVSGLNEDSIESWDKILRKYGVQPLASFARKAKSRILELNHKREEDQKARSDDKIKSIMQEKLLKDEKKRIESMIEAFNRVKRYPDSSELQGELHDRILEIRRSDEDTMTTSQTETFEEARSLVFARLAKSIITHAPHASDSNPLDLHNIERININNLISAVRGLKLRDKPSERNLLEALREVFQSGFTNASPREKKTINDAVSYIQAAAIDNYEEWQKYISSNPVQPFRSLAEGHQMPD